MVWYGMVEVCEGAIPTHFGPIFLCKNVLTTFDHSLGVAALGGCGAHAQPDVYRW